MRASPGMRQIEGTANKFIKSLVLVLDWLCCTDKELIKYSIKHTWIDVAIDVPKYKPSYSVLLQIISRF
jgi:hypothetical protein